MWQEGLPEKQERNWAVDADSADSCLPQDWGDLCYILCSKTFPNQDSNQKSK